MDINKITNIKCIWNGIIYKYLYDSLKRMILNQDDKFYQSVSYKEKQFIKRFNGGDYTNANYREEVLIPNEFSISYVKGISMDFDKCKNSTIYDLDIGKSSESTPKLVTMYIFLDFIYNGNANNLFYYVFTIVNAINAFIYEPADYKILENTTLGEFLKTVSIILPLMLVRDVYTKVDKVKLASIIDYNKETITKYIGNIDGSIINKIIDIVLRDNSFDEIVDNNLYL